MLALPHYCCLATVSPATEMICTNGNLCSLEFYVGRHMASVRVALLYLACQNQPTTNRVDHTTLGDRANSKLAGMLVMCLYRCLVVDNSQQGTAPQLQ